MDYGVGPKKLKKFGRIFIDEISKFSPLSAEEQGLISLQGQGQGQSDQNDC